MEEIRSEYYSHFLWQFLSQHFGAKNTFDKGPFLLVRFLWAIKENEQDKTVKSKRSKTGIVENKPLKYAMNIIFPFEKRLGRYYYLA